MSKPGNLAPTVQPGQEQRTLASVENVAINREPINPAGSSVEALFAGSFADTADSAGGQASANTFAGVAVVGNAAALYQGNWQYRATTNSAWQSLPNVGEANPFVLTNAAELRFLPRPGFVGTPGQLSVRLLENSQTWSTGALPSPLVVGGSGAASAALVTLSTAITAAPQAPSSLELAAGALLRLNNSPTIATLIAEDPDTLRSNLRFSLTPNAFDAGLLNLDEETGELTLKDGADATAVRERGYLEIEVSVSDGAQALTKIIRISTENETNQAPTINLSKEESSRPSWAPLDNPTNLPYQVYLPSIEQG